MATQPISTATFTSSTFTFDPLLAGEPISQSAEIAGGHGLLTRGTVLFGPALGTPITGSTPLTPVSGTGAARAILAADVDTTSGEIMALVYTQGKFLDTAMTFTAQGAAADAAQLWQSGIYVLTVQQRSGLLVPMIGLPVTGGPLPQSTETADEVESKAKDLAARAREYETKAKEAATLAKQLEAKAHELHGKERDEEAKRDAAAKAIQPHAEHHGEPIKQEKEGQQPKPPIPNPPSKR
jgi:hypothetical protein